jgi:CRISPR/Cas system CSM-associated protein Csm3 (group 7 of RAMP superfamily)
MSAFTLTFDLQSDWHIGSGKEAGAYADSLTIKDDDGLPFLPGKSIKGLLREAFTIAQANSWCTDIEKAHDINNLTDALFGSEGQGVESQGMFQLSSATLSCDEVAFFNQQVNAKAHLFRIIQSTEIDHKTGVATKGSLRSMEVSVPMTLKSELELNSSHSAFRPELAQALLPLLNACCGLILELGAKRHRGLGQVSVRADKNNHQQVA